MDKHDGRTAAEPEVGPLDGPWSDALALRWDEWDYPTDHGDETHAIPAAPPVPKPRSAEHDEVYLAVQRSAAFQEVRRRYRGFVIPATVLFLVWYLAYVIAATAAPHLMARHVIGAVNVAMLAGLGQFITTFFLTWAYARHARLRRDNAALDIRWETQELTGGNLR
ncbi:DUF485 domain-containing protein [Streptomyces sp. NPDC050161]|uniref:DUF485 domain-containing protein n=1 Tax=unclassified Streptomyces TaxID=2593676 RepID=UPI00371E639B